MAGGMERVLPAAFFIENRDQFQQLTGAGRQMRGHFGDLVTEAGQVFDMLVVGEAAGAGKPTGLLAWHGEDHGGIP